MRYPIIIVRDKLTGHEHIVGTDTHDTLYVGDDGGIHYYNLQNGEGTGRNGDYEFVGVDDEYALGPEIEFVQVDQTEVQRLREAAIKLHETINSFWQGDCDKADVVAAQSNLCDVLGADRDDELYGDWIDERCPKCGANLLGNKVGDKWCSLVGCDYSIDAPEKVGTEEWRHKYFGAEWPKVEGDENA